MKLGSCVTAVRSTRVLIGNEVCPAVIIIENGKIKQIVSHADFTEVDGSQVLDAGNSLVMPGIVDCHVHVNEPGRTSWEGFWTATRAAAAGGVTTIVDMPLNSVPPTTTLGNFQEKQREAAGKCFVDTAFWGGVIPGNQLELRPMIQAGVAGFKCFLIHSGVDEFPHVTDSDLHSAMKQLQDTGSVLLFHAERDVEANTDGASDPRQYSTFLQSRPDVMETEAIRIVTELCRQYQVRCHIVHLSSAQPLELIQAARQSGAPLTVETTHHYLSLCAEDIPVGATQFKCCPPIRGSTNRELLWSALKEGKIDMVVSDHSPCTPELKKLERGDFTQAWGGISSLQFGLSLFWSSASKRGFTLPDVVRLLCHETARLCRLDNQKGCLAPGYDADLVIWDPEKEFEIKEGNIHHKNKLTPYLGATLQGLVRTTIIRGQLVYRDGCFCPEPLGQLLLLPSRTHTAHL
ncbi:allantoinase, mitochondrial isoform X1 [Synchiropus splendidus]|uniref:allantoinase, mitochondrial isoform X1 n=2 Tax=Synchiropus splendidus TaxID=270530 RepID=UPI00237D93A7|nr:allantoinase, mitochondrial isoform X1 [Synchiropus splendidus]XP_053706231.1 allantoinase, mitochondrial isoform X1 [Synchiropus splendidus]XP_053706240.1 allantoinase, mitochondrial isoform X1 [Synchiropus splendidus]XP_053706249.1 allantoinase, mitochondrial isoform X1 [Synchiropus splendidus]XP_053706257.1 allantoinase, mitochondrial isoform X1 [Synchiropus splendidus]XP_053706267.1 allantoinase, mitochondrial isoform X1 [Synchiropus splendidus]XP_053706274.1 allantoinase, mitochondria